MLDFGCGQGDLVALGRSRGLDMIGADTFTDWFDVDDPRLFRIEEGRLPFADGRFSVVVSNQVFEHIADPRPALSEIRRVLRPGGTFIALFPVRETLFEGHVRLYFAHYLRNRPALLRRYLGAARRLGLGALSVAEGVRGITEACFYHRTRDVYAWWREAFGADPVPLEHEMMRTILGDRATSVRPSVLRVIYRARGGLAISARKPA